MLSAPRINRLPSPFSEDPSAALPAPGAWKRIVLEGWERFGTRHIFLWMFSLAVSTFVFQCLDAIENGLHGASWARNDGFSANSIPLTLVAMSAGTILGLGLPVILTGPKESLFLEHPARVLFTLFASLTLLDLVARCLSSSMSSALGSMNDLAVAAGMVSTGFIWSVYALIRPRIGWIWRLATLFCCLALANDFAFLCQIISDSNATGRRFMPYVQAPHLFAIVSVGGSLAVACTILVAGIVEILFGKFRDWRVWLATFVLPACLTLSQSPSVFELLRSYQIDSQRPNTISFAGDEPLRQSI